MTDTAGVMIAVHFGLRADLGALDNRQQWTAFEFPQRSLSLGGGNWCSWPTPHLRVESSRYWWMSNAVVRSNGENGGRSPQTAVAGGYREPFRGCRCGGTARLFDPRSAVPDCKANGNATSRELCLTYQAQPDQREPGCGGYCSSSSSPPLSATSRRWRVLWWSFLTSLVGSRYV